MYINICNIHKNTLKATDKSRWDHHLPCYTYVLYNATTKVKPLFIIKNKNCCQSCGRICFSCINPLCQPFFSSSLELRQIFPSTFI